MARWDSTILISNVRTINNITLSDPDILKNLLMAGYTEISSPVTGSWKDEITQHINNKASFSQLTFIRILFILFYDSNTLIQNPVGKKLKGNPFLLKPAFLYPEVICFIWVWPVQLLLCIFCLLCYKRNNSYHFHNCAIILRTIWFLQLRKQSASYIYTYSQSRVENKVQNVFI